MQLVVSQKIESSNLFKTANAGVMELAYVLALEARFCGFDSHLPHHKEECRRWLNGTALKAEGGKTHGGSNPSSSSIRTVGVMVTYQSPKLQDQGSNPWRCAKE